jgi:uncharacterized membrane protein HdeD (DUF308 family)
MLHTLARHWWTLVLRGIAALIFALLAFLMPGITILVLVLLFGFYAIVDGVVNLIAAFRAGVRSHWFMLLEGLVSVAAGILTLVWPHITALVLIYLIGFWAIFTGVFELIAAFRLWRVFGSEWLLLLSGIASLIFGFLVLAVPLAGALAVVIWIAAYAAVFGVLLISFGLRLRHHHHGGGMHAEPTPRPA